MRSVHALVKEKAGRRPLPEIKIMKDDAAAVERRARTSRPATSDFQGVTGRSENRSGDHGQRAILQPRRAQGAAAALAAHRFAARVRSRGAAGVGDHARADRGREEGGQGRLLHLGRPAAGREDRASVRSQVSRHRRARRAHRRRARVPPHRPGICEPHLAVDIVNSSDAAHLIVWKREGLLAPYVPEDVAKHIPTEHKDPDGMFASFRVILSASATTPIW